MRSLRSLRRERVSLPPSHPHRTPPSQLRVVFGDAAQTASRALEELRATRLLEGAPEPACNVLSIDGDHTVEGVLRDWRAFRGHLAPGAVIFLDDIGPRHPVWAERGLLRVGCVSLPGVADDRPRALPMAATESFCVAVHQFECVRYGVGCEYNSLGQEEDVPTSREAMQHALRHQAAAHAAAAVAHE